MDLSCPLFMKLSLFPPIGHVSLPGSWVAFGVTWADSRAQDFPMMFAWLILVSFQNLPNLALLEGCSRLFYFGATFCFFFDLFKFILLI